MATMQIKNSARSAHTHNYVARPDKTGAYCTVKGCGFAITSNLIAHAIRAGAAVAPCAEALMPAPDRAAIARLRANITAFRADK